MTHRGVHGAHECLLLDRVGVTVQALKHRRAQLPLCGENQAYLQRGEGHTTGAIQLLSCARSPACMLVSHREDELSVPCKMLMLHVQPRAAAAAADARVALPRQLVSLEGLLYKGSPYLPES